ncbi:MAG TPA: hypothetical protein VFZ41_04800, partial [Solirubrobacterales bacterium]
RRRLTTISLFGATSASAFTEVGNNCIADSPVPAAEFTVFQVEQNIYNPLPLAVASPGVVTKWRVNITKEAGEESIPQQLVVLRALGNPGEFLAVAKGAVESVTGGQNIFDTRIPVQAGDRFGTYSELGTALCEFGSSTDKVAGIEGSLDIGSAGVIGISLENSQLPLSAIVEPDADGDGYGDETQDFCPTDASVQGACPQPAAASPPPPPPADLALDSFPLPDKRSLLILVTPTVRATVSVSGTVRVPRAKKRRARSSALIRLRGPRRTVNLGQIGRLRLRFTRPLLSALRALPKGRSLTLRIVVTARDDSGRTVKDTSRLKLKGQKARKR